MLDWKKKLKFIAITSAFAVLILIVLSNVVKMTQVSDKDIKTYRQGLTYLKAKDFENAYFNFSNVSKNSAINEIALLRQGLCADDLNDYETAAKKYRLFIEKYPESMFIQKAYYSLAQNYFREKEYNKAEKTFNDIRKMFKDSDYKTASSYYLGVIYKDKALEKFKNIKEEKGKESEKEALIEALKKDKDVLQNKQKAKNYFTEYLQDAPNGRLAMNAVNETVQLEIPLNQKDYYLLGRTCFKNGAIKTAYDFLNKSYMSSSWAYLAEIYRKQGNYKKYKEIFDNNYAKYSQNLEEEELYGFLENYAASYPGGAKQGWQNLIESAEKESAQNAKGEDFILYKLAKIEDKNKSQQRNFLYNKIFQTYPQGKFASDALANLFWEAYQTGKYEEAFRIGSIHIRDYQNTIAAPQILYWMGKLAERQGNRTEAKGFYERVVQKYPDNYYAYRASTHLSSNQNKGWRTKSTHRLPERNQIIRFPIKAAGISDENISLINAIIKLNDYSLLGEIDKENKAIQSWINYKEGKFATAALLARDAISDMETKPDFSDSIYKIAYQLHYQDTINDCAKRFVLDPYLVTALIREESYFNPKVQSSVGATGLMQLMPATASYIATKNNIPYYGVSSLLNPDKNIELGCAYLDYAKSKLYEDDLLAVASYNGGPNAVRGWKDTLNYRNFDEFIENIPYPETRDYVKKVFRSYWIYLNVY